MVCLAGTYIFAITEILTCTCGLLNDGRTLLLQDRTCIVWDLAKEVYFVRELGDHPDLDSGECMNCVYFYLYSSQMVSEVVTGTHLDNAHCL